VLRAGLNSVGKMTGQPDGSILLSMVVVKSEVSGS
jgi:hypothetical protein